MSLDNHPHLSRAGYATLADYEFAMSQYASREERLRAERLQLPNPASMKQDDPRCRSNAGTLKEWDNGTAIVACDDGKERAVAG